MSFRYLWIVSISSHSVLYLRRFPNVEKRAQSMGLSQVIIRSDEQLIKSLLSSLAITYNKNEWDSSVANQLPVIQLNYNSVKLWPVIVIEQNGILFCCYPLCDNQSYHLIDQKSISLCFTALQTIANYFANEKSLTWIEWLITSLLPFGTLINNKYQPIDNTIRKVTKLENKLQNDLLKVIINELISGTKDNKEMIFGTINVDHSSCSAALIENCLISLQIRNIDSLSLILGPNYSLNSSGIQIKLPLQSNPLHIIHYKCKSSHISPAKTFLSYDYSINRDINENNLYKIKLLINLKNSTQFRFSYFNVHFKQMSEKASFTPTKSNLNFGQLRNENIGLFWVIGNKFPKSGQIKLSFDVICLNRKLLEMETICNFKIENFQSSLLCAESEHLSIDDVKLTVNGKLPVLIESTLTSIDYKLFPDFK